MAEEVREVISMKKKYEKPQIFFEDFQLSANIAGDCKYRSSNATNDQTCGYLDNEWYVFQSENMGCDFPVEGTGKYDRFCYHVPTGDMSVFVS